MPRLGRSHIFRFAVVASLCLASHYARAAEGPSFKVSFPKTRSEKPIDGRILLVLSTDPSDEPRNQINDTPKTQMLFGLDVDGMQPGETKVVDSSADGYPIKRLRDVPAGEYYVQVVLHRYETFHRADGHTVKMPWIAARASTGTWRQETYCRSRRRFR